jgi:hypothetical protein
MDKPESSLVGIDIMDFFYGDKKTPVGQVALDYFPDLPESKWNLITGKDPVEIVDDLNIKFDFAIIDTAHVMPAEVLNFLTVLPYLKDGAIVVFHDISIYSSAFTRNAFASKFLEIAVTAPKLYPKEYTYNLSGQTFTQVNIFALQITDDTRKYIQSVFSALKLPWVIQHDEKTSALFYDFFSRHYGREAAGIYKTALEYQRILLIDFAAEFKKKIKDRDFCLFGAGMNSLLVMNSIKKIGAIPLYILDSFAPVGTKEIAGEALTVYRPNENPNAKAVIVVTINYPDAVISELEAKGYIRGETVFSIDDICQGK